MPPSRTASHQRQLVWPSPTGQASTETSILFSQRQRLPYLNCSQLKAFLKRQLTNSCIWFESSRKWLPICSMVIRRIKLTSIRLIRHWVFGRGTAARSLPRTRWMKLRSKYFIRIIKISYCKWLWMNNKRTNSKDFKLSIAYHLSQQRTNTLRTGTVTDEGKDFTKTNQHWTVTATISKVKKKVARAWPGTIAISSPQQ